MSVTKRKIAESRIALLLRAPELDFDAISSALGLQATATRRKGDLINRLPEIVAEADEWAYIVPLNAPEGEDEALNALLECMLSHQAEIAELEKTAQITLRLHVQSDHAQIAYCLMPETLRKLASTGLPLQVSTLSWGEVAL